MNPLTFDLYLHGAGIVLILTCIFLIVFTLFGGWRMNVAKLHFWKRTEYVVYIAADFKTLPKDIHRLFKFRLKKRSLPDLGYVQRKFFKSYIKDGWIVRSISVREDI